MKIDFQTVDVFTREQFGGNPLAVVPDARGLSTEQMQLIAAEFNLSETTFVLPAKDVANTAEVRIFTPKAEMPFAGHPNVGTAYVLARRGEVFGKPLNAISLRFEEKAGLVAVDVLRDGETVVGARLTAPQRFSIDDELPIDVVAAACGVSPSDIKTDRHPPRLASSGAIFAFAELQSLAALAKAAPSADVFADRLPRDRATGIHLYVQQSNVGADIQTRMFAPLHGVFEDPATGSANVALAGLLASLDTRRDLSLSKSIAQGIEMGRPSFMEAAAQKSDGVVTVTTIGGRCVPMMTGSLEVS
jgi:trans-2,3-dihydro-3-hydroxyanthranilate isomerase